MSTPTRWHGCYTESWQDLCVPEAFSHPAKFSRGLIHRIYRHALAQRYLQPGMTVLDPFGGVALGALDAMTYGLGWLGCELEPRFHALGLANLALWRRRYGFDTGALVCGDSRVLRQVVAGEWQGLITSPPYEETVLSGGPTQNKQGYTQGARALTDYGTTPGQLGAMPAGAVITSPPYAASLHLNESEEADIQRLARKNVPVKGGVTSRKALPSSQANQGYGTTPGNLGNLRAGAVVTSPPFMDAHKSGGGIAGAIVGKGTYHVTTRIPRNCYQQAEQGTTSGNLANDKPDTFWQAAAAILTECHALLAPQSVAIFVLKDYVRNKQRVPFCAHWRACCEAVGYTFVEEIHAMLVEDHGTQTGLFTADTTITTERKSFFRRLAERKGSPRIDWETVLVMRRP